MRNPLLFVPSSKNKADGFTEGRHSRPCSSIYLEVSPRGWLVAVESSRAYPVSAALFGTCSGS